MKISVCCPTRNRKHILPKGINSVLDNVYEISNIEVILRFDLDDVETLREIMKYYNVKLIKHRYKTEKFKWGLSSYQVFDTFSRKRNVFMKFILGHRHTYFFLNRYIDEYQQEADGEYIMHWTDDLVMLPNEKYLGWDLILKEGEGQHYFFFFREDSLTGKARFPVCTPKKFYEINGRLCPNLLDDQWYEECCKLLPAGTRVIIEWATKHECLFGKIKSDETAENGRKAFTKYSE